jgi:hypothetical protein
MPIDTKGFDRKMSRMQNEMRRVLRALIRDAAAYLQSRIVGEVINGPAGLDSPKSGYPSGVSTGESGFVGVQTGNLKRSIQNRKESELEWRIFSENVISPYNEYVDSWSREKYGKGFFDIALELYSKGMLKLFADELSRFVRAVSSGSIYNYQNPFPV